MAKKTAPRIASKDKKATDTKPKKQQKAAEPAVEKLFEENEDEWEDESDGEATKPTSKKAKGKKSKKAAIAPVEDESSDESEGGHGFDLDLARLDESDSDSEMEDADGNEDSESEDDDEEEEIDVDDLSIGNSSDEEEIAATTRVRETINNKDALLAALKRIQLDTSSSVPFAYHQSVISVTPTADAITSIDDDLARELAFMNQSLEAARRARTLLRKEGVPFTRPTDYFAETVRSDETMDKVKAKLIEEASSKKASAEARKLRDLKKFGKQVQVAKQQERAKQKRETLEKISELKKKRKEGASSALGATEADDIFDVAVDNELKSAGKKRSFSAGEHGNPNAKRQKKDTKYGFGGKKKHLKSNDATSSADIGGFSAKRMKSGGGAGPKKPFKAPRLGKARRKAGAGKR
ncbi:eukaryotic rRNA processing protein EBP2-domain-containing protein [Cercophora newfieldiana]|uniref:Eukaryotic rRNA processing protein EBP2-domain-containing protein n=1 Tax=Cercophora newfieldiana TaxID=92897 RepID=A0AA39XTY2_9PEZI|nr:eukaryotic rRNA processing protein EBP2-domain-containing protein [Cercophora newfieldiana]